jgi:hypothetical protein
MAVSSVWRSIIPEILQRLPAGERRGLEAAGAIVEAGVRERLSHGYTTGAFNTGEIARSVQLEPVVGKEIKVSTPSVAALGWELGHYNLFLRRHIRVEIWRPTLNGTRQAQAVAYARAVRAEARI